MFVNISVIFAITFNLFLLSTSQSNNDQLYPVSIIHLNDFHARYEETSVDSNTCKRSTGEKCVGGYARVVGMVKKLQQEHASASYNPIYLNAGDNFQGTLWYDILRWNVTSHFLNLLPADAITIGNHEFDHSIEGLAPFLKTLTSTVVVSNIDATNEPTIQGLYKKSIVIDRYRKKIGVIGVTLQNFQFIETIENRSLKFLDETKSIIDEATKLKENGVDIIIVLSHCGLDKDIEIARKVGSGVDVIVGGHSHTFMFTGDVPPGPDKPEADYPTIITQDNGHKVLIVQAAAYSKYLGNLIVWFDENGEIKKYEGGPIFLDENVVQDADILEELKPFKKIVDQEALVVIGESKVALNSNECNYGECAIGNLVTDAYAHSWIDKAENSNYWSGGTIALEQNSGIRTSLAMGEITYGDLKTAFPFDNTIDSFDLRGDYLWQTFEDTLSKSIENGKRVPTNMLQTSGLQITANLSLPVGQRVISVNVLCRQCKVPEYLPLKKDELYRIVASSYFTKFSIGVKALQDNLQNYRTGGNVFEIIQDYIKRITPIILSVGGRLELYT